jgi:[acyl-carrier-protein] S-malonyltransferase
MLKDLERSYASVRATFAEASAVLGYDLWDLIQQGPDAELNKTEKTQPAMLAAGVALWRVWEAQGGARPASLAGHSLGEYTALVCAGALPFPNAVALVADRGRYMQEAVPVGAGAMAAVLGLDDALVAKACEIAAAGQVVGCANFNSPGQVVIAGAATAVDRAVREAQALGAKRALILPVSVPSHCELMRSAASRLFDRLQGLTLSVPQIPVVHNVDVSIHSTPEAIAQALVEQLYRPVRWVEVVQRIAADGMTTVIECGPGKVLAGLCKRIDERLDCLAIFNTASVEATLAATRT